MVYSTRRFVVCLSMCHFVLVFFSPFSITITSHGKERANLNAFTYVYSVRACLDLSVFSSSRGLGRDAVCDYGTPWTFLLPFLRPDIADLSDHCPVISLQTLEVRLCQWPSLAGMEHCIRTQELYTPPGVLEERWRKERTDRSLNCFQAESMSPR